MNYIGNLYGRIGRTYIPLTLTSEDVDRIVYEHEVMTENLSKIIGPFVIPPEADKNRIIKPMNIPNFNFDQLSPIISSFEFDKKTS